MMEYDVDSLHYEMEHRDRVRERWEGREEEEEKHEDNWGE